MVRLLLNASVGWKSMRMVRNEDAVVAGLVAAVQQWNAESCLLRRFDRNVAAVSGCGLPTGTAIRNNRSNSRNVYGLLGGLRVGV